MRFMGEHWMKVLMSLLLVFLLLAPASAAEPQKLPLETPQEVAAFLQEISVTIKAGHAEGSGTAVVRKIGKEDVTFILTAAHVVDGLRSEKEVVAPDGTKRTKVTFDDCSLVQEVRQEGRRVGEWKFDAKVIRFNTEQDLAALEVRKRGFLKHSAEFWKSDVIPAVGTELFHCGSPGGQTVGANSVTDGSVAQIGRTFEGETGEFDQATVSSLPGSSGGGVFEKDSGAYVGMLTMGLRGQDSFAYYIPIRRIQNWAEESGMLWLIDGTVKPPTKDELDDMPVEETSFGSRTNAEEDTEEKGMYYLIRREDAPVQD